MADGSGREFRVGQVVSRSLALYRQNLLLLLALSLAVLLLGELPKSLPARPYLAMPRFGLTVLCALGAVWVRSAMIVLASERSLGRTATLARSLAGVRGHYWRFVVVSILCMVLSFLGLVVFAVPGIYLWVVLLLSPVVAILEDAQGIGSLRRSIALVKGSFWRTFCLQLVLLSLGLVSLMAWASLNHGHTRTAAMAWSRGISLLLIPFEATLLVVLYHTLKEREAPGASERRGKGAPGAWLGCGTMLVLGVVALPLGAVWGAFLGPSVAGVLREAISLQTMSLPGGVELPRPAGWWAYQAPEDRRAYRLSKWETGRTVSVQLWTKPVHELGVAAEGAPVGDERVAEGIQKEYARRFPSKSDDQYALQRLRTVSLAGREWADVTFSRPYRSGGRSRSNVLRHAYAVHSGQAVVFTWHHWTDQPPSDDDTAAIAEAEQKVYALIGAVQFPKIAAPEPPP